MFISHILTLTFKSVLWISTHFINYTTDYFLPLILNVETLRMLLIDHSTHNTQYITHTMDTIQGFSYIKDFITNEEEIQLLDILDKQVWDTTLSRRTLHYGWRYPYNAFSSLEPTQSIPQWIIPFKTRIEGHLKCDFDQVIINEYLPGQGIAPHVDNTVLFDDTVAVISIGSDIIVQMSHRTKPTVNVNIHRRSLYVLQDLARYAYRHSIPRRKCDNLIPRKTRYSLTFRKKQ